MVRNVASGWENELIARRAAHFITAVTSGKGSDE